MTINVGSSPFIRKDKLYPLLDEILGELTNFAYALRFDLNCNAYASEILDLVEKIKKELEYGNES